jgi:hypothetical protein
MEETALESVKAHTYFICLLDNFTLKDSVFEVAMNADFISGTPPRILGIEIPFQTHNS